MPSLAVNLPQDQPEELKPVLQIEDLHTWFEVRRLGFSKPVMYALWMVSPLICTRAKRYPLSVKRMRKTTLAKTILGLHPPPQRERFFFEDQDLTSFDKEGWKYYRSNIGYIQQDPYGALPPFMSVKRILEEPMKINGIRDKDEQKEGSGRS